VTTPPTELSIAEVSTWLSGLTRQLDRALAPEHRDAVGARLRAAAGGSRAPLGALMNLALLADCVSVAQLAIEADGGADADELARAQPLVQIAARKYFQVLPAYEAYGEPELSHTELAAFLTAHRADVSAFGGARADWPGIALCREIATAASHAGLLREHERMLNRVMAAVFAGRARDAETSARRRLRARFELDTPAAAEDPRAIAFCRPDGPDVFAAVAHGSQIHERDPLDVEAIHAEARAVFHDQIEHAITPIRHVGSHGRTMLVLGGSGSGKTHLMRAFRTHVHGERLGYVGYLQMTAEAGDYARYVLQNLVDSLERPYDAPSLTESSLMYLSTGLAEHDGAIAKDQLELLRTAELDAPAATRLAGALVDRLMRTEALATCETDLIQALLLLQRRDPAIQRRVVKFLRCDGLTPYEQELLGGLQPRTQPEDPQRTLEQLAALAFHLHHAALVLLVDQIEDTLQNDAEGYRRAARAIDVLRKLADAVPSAIVVIACLDDVYDELKPRLTKSVIDRLEHEPAPVRLTYQRGRDEVEALLTSRLEHLYDSFDVAWRPDDPIYPFTAADLDRVTNQRARDVLVSFHKVHQECIATGRIADRGTAAAAAAAAAAAPPAEPDAAQLADLDRAWQDARAAAPPMPDDDDDAMLELVMRGIAACAAELGAPLTTAIEEDRLVVGGIPGASDRLIEICNKVAQGGHLGKQIDDLRTAAAPHQTPVALRVGEFAFGPKSGTATKVGLLLAAQGLALPVASSELRAIAAMHAFAAAQRAHPQLAAWRARAQPIAQLPMFRTLLAAGVGVPPAVAPRPAPAASARTPVEPGAVLSPMARSATAPGQAPGPAPAAPRAAAPTTPPAGGVRLGVGPTLRAEPVHVELEHLTRHAAFLGGPGSGATTLALHLIEQLLERGISAVVVDRTGELAPYASRAWWDQPTGDAQRDLRKQALRDRVAVALYTPGDSTGRPLGLPLIPPGMAALSSGERDQLAKLTAAGLAAMMQYGRGEKFTKRTAILKAAIELHAATGDATIEELQATIARPDPQLLAAVGQLGRHFAGLAEDLDMLWINHKRLLDPGGERLDVAAMLAPRDAGARLSIISTAALPDAATAQFWVSRLVVELVRHAKANPSPTLQAVALFDDAELYVPAGAAPATKEPMFELLRRGRAGGLGVLLATEQPGELDYGARENIATWFLGKVGQARVLEKMRHLLAGHPHVATRLAGQSPGNFFVLSASAPVRELRADPAILAIG
jgi:hypothetical protein